MTITVTVYKNKYYRNLSPCSYKLNEWSENFFSTQQIPTHIKRMTELEKSPFTYYPSSNWFRQESSTGTKTSRWKFEVKIWEGISY